MNLLQKIFKNSFLAFFSLLITILFLLGCIFFYMYLELPEVSSLKNMQLQVPLRVFTRDGKLIAEYGENHRIPVELDEVPKKLIQAVLATEDQRYFEHVGVDFIGLLRATKAVALTGKPTQGASTITMQVARNFFLTRQKTIGRKLNEILLALKIDASLSKEKVLELYLNQIYLGQHAYGVAAAAQIYFGKELKDLNLNEMAVIAGLPQAPSRDNPIDNPTAALERRNHVLERMFSNGFITEQEYKGALSKPITVSFHRRENTIDAPFVGEMVRAAMVEAYGNSAYTNGLKVYTTIDSQMQVAANAAIRSGLMVYDRRHGFRGAENQIRKTSQWIHKLRETPTLNGMVPAVVIKPFSNTILALLANHQKIIVQKSNWNASRLKTGDVIRVQKNQKDEWQLTQVPKVEGALVSLDPHTGAVIALNGGFSFNQSSYNRATQAKRQPGSSFKPFIYSAALERGFTLASLVNDAPLIQYIPGTNKIWAPQNANQKFYGPTRLRMGLVHSRNLVSIRILQSIGISYAINYATRFGFNPSDLPPNLTLALGTGSTTPMQLASAYATFANGGYLVKPYFIHHITDDNGKILYQAETPKLERTISAENAYLLNNVLQDVVKLGTGRPALALERTDIAGKTGTTNDQIDGWFAGYNGDVVTTVWVGFDQHQSLREYGAQAALPIWIDYMRAALAGKPQNTLSKPPNIVQLPIDPGSGRLMEEGQPYAVYEYFDKTNVPNDEPDFADADGQDNQTQQHAQNDDVGPRMEDEEITKHGADESPSKNYELPAPEEEGEDLY